MSFHDRVKATEDRVEISQCFRQVISGPRLSIVEFLSGITVLGRERTTEERFDDASESTNERAGHQLLR
jgi:hypothetical protein